MTASIQDNRDSGMAFPSGDNSSVNVNTENTGTPDNFNTYQQSSERPLLEVQKVTRSFGLGKETVEILHGSVRFRKIHTDEYSRLSGSADKR